MCQITRAKKIKVIYLETSGVSHKHVDVTDYSFKECLDSFTPFFQLYKI